MRIGIVGLGALGCSLGLALRAQKAWQDVTGYDTSARVQNEAKRKNAIQEGTSDIPDLLSDADIVILAIPALAVIDFLREYGAGLRSSTVVTDLAVTKRAILEAAEKHVPARSAFVGGHPVVSCQPGIEHANVALYKGKSWCLAPAMTAGADRIEAVGAIIEAVGAYPYFVDPQEHDAWAAAVDGLPLITAAMLARVVADSGAFPEIARVASQPFDEATRHVSRGKIDGTDIALTNPLALVSWLERLQVELDAWREAIAEGRVETLARRFDAAATARAKWETERKKEVQARL